MDEVCCICLDPPNKDDPLLLLSCGCKVALFHKACEIKWTDNLPIDTPIKCLICKREPIMKLNYCFAYDVGYPQKILWTTSLVFALELPLALYYNTSIIFLQGSFIILYPFVAPFSYDLTYFLANYITMISMNILFLFVYGTNLKSTTIILHRFLYMAVIFFHINTHKKINPLIPFVISREITYAKIAWDPQSK